MALPGSEVPLFSSAAALGILYAEDFDTDAASGRGAPASPPVEPAAPVITPADVDAACAAAVRSALEEWEASQLRERIEALGRLTAAIQDIRDEARQQAEQAAEALARTTLALVAAALPALCERHGEAELRRLVRQLLPGLVHEAKIVVRVHPESAAVLQQDINQITADWHGAISVAPAPLPPGDLRVTWADGSFTRDTGAILAGLRDEIAQLGLLETTRTPDFECVEIPQRRMALAG